MPVLIFICLSWGAMTLSQVLVLAPLNVLGSLWPPHWLVWAGVGLILAWCIGEGV